MRTIQYTNAFSKDMKKVKTYNSFKPSKFKQYVTDLASGNELPPAARNHKLSKASPSQYKGMYDFHVAPDICVIYNIDEDSITLVRIGQHNNLGLTEDM